MRARFGAWPVVALALSGCAEPPLPATCGFTTFFDTVQVSQVDQVDLLFVIDDSSTMSEAQSALAARLPHMILDLDDPRFSSTPLAQRCTTYSDALHPIDRYVDGASTTVQSICSDDLVPAIDTILERTSVPLRGSCAPRSLSGVRSLDRESAISSWCFRPSKARAPIDAAPISSTPRRTSSWASSERGSAARSWIERSVAFVTSVSPVRERSRAGS